MYQLISHPISGQEPNIVLHLESGSYIPFDPANTDYQEYLEWVAEGNTPTPADS